MATAPSLIPFPPRGSARKLSLRAQQNEQLRTKRKIDQADRVLSTLEERVSRIDQRMKELKRTKDLMLSRAEKIENGVLSEMQRLRAEQLIGNQVTLSTRANAPSLQVLDQSKVPAEYIREKLIQDVDKVAVKVALARGEEIDGVKLVQSVSLLRKH